MLATNETPGRGEPAEGSNEINHVVQGLVSQKSAPVKSVVERSTASLRPDLDESGRFLIRLNGGPEGEFTFLAIDDDKTRNAPPSPEKHGTLAQAANFIENATLRGYGVFVTVNKTNLKGRKETDILGVRALFVDLDGAPIEPVLDCEIPPDIVVESSRSKYHAYWLNDGSITLDQFKPLQKQLIIKFNGDKCVHDLPRIMRLPGSWHQKVSKEGVRSEPFQTKVIKGGVQ